VDLDLVSHDDQEAASTRGLQSLTVFLLYTAVLFRRVPRLSCWWLPNFQWHWHISIDRV